MRTWILSLGPTVNSIGIMALGAGCAVLLTWLLPEPISFLMGIPVGIALAKWWFWWLTHE